VCGRKARAPTGAAQLTEPGETSFTRLAFTGSLGAFVVIGAIDAAYGPLLRPISDRFAVSLALAGTVISINFAGALTGVLCALAAFGRAPTRPIAACAQAVVGVGCLTIALSRGWAVLAVGVFLAGAGFGATDFSLNQLMARTRPHGRGARLTILNAAFGAGAVLAPVCAGILGARTLVLGFAVLSVIAFAMAVGLMGISTAAGGADQRPDPPARAGSEGRARSARRYAGVAVAALGYLLYVGCESGTAGWIPAHLEAFGYSSGFATAVTSGFWAAMTVGRIAVVAASRVVTARRIVLVCSPLLAVTLALAAVPAIAPACYVAAGFAAAPIFPIGLDWIAAGFPRDRPATSWALTGSFAGGIVGPAVVSVAVSLAGVYSVPAVLTSLAGASAVTFFALGKKVIRREPRTVP
jgi:MFS transporter, FHS family, glucose/mannose:H+ symporter